MVIGNDIVINPLGFIAMGQKNCKLKPELVNELVRKTYCESPTCFYYCITIAAFIFVKQLHV